MPKQKQKRKRGHGWTVQKKPSVPPDPVLEWWDIVAIEGEHEDGRYLVRWDGNDPSTGRPWERSYVAREHVKGPLVRRWQKQAALNSRNNDHSQRLTDPPSLSDNTPETDRPHSPSAHKSWKGSSSSQYRFSTDDTYGPYASNPLEPSADLSNMNGPDVLMNLRYPSPDPRYPTPLDYIPDVQKTIIVKIEDED